MAVYDRGAFNQQTLDYEGGYIYTSGDYGMTWQVQTAPGFRHWADLTISSNGTLVTAVAYNGYIFTSTDFGVTWNRAVNLSLDLHSLVP